MAEDGCGLYANFDSVRTLNGQKNDKKNHLYD